MRSRASLTFFDASFSYFSATPRASRNADSSEAFAADSASSAAFASLAADSAARSFVSRSAISDRADSKADDASETEGAEGAFAAAAAAADCCFASLSASAALRASSALSAASSAFAAASRLAASSAASRSAYSFAMRRISSRRASASASPSARASAASASSRSRSLAPMFITLMFARAKFVSRRAAVSSSCRNSISSILLCIASFAERNAAISSARVPSRARTKSATASRAATDLYGFFVFGTLGSAASTPSSSSSSYPSIKPLICASSSGSVSARRSPSKTATPVALVKVSRKPSLTRSRSIFDRNVLPTTPAPEASALAARVPSVPSVAASSVGGVSFFLDPAAASASAAALVFSLKLFAMVAETSTRAAAPVVLFTPAVVFVAEAVFALALALFFLNTVPSCTPSKEVETSVETEVSTSVAETSAFAIVVVVVSVVSVVVSSTTSVASFLIASSFATTSLEALAPTELAAASSSPSGPGVDDAAFARARPPRGARDGSNHPARITGASDREFARRPGPRVATPPRRGGAGQPRPHSAW